MTEPRSGRQEGLEVLVEMNSDGILIVDGDGIVLYANPAAQRLLDKKADQLLGTAFGFPVSAHGDAQISLLTGGKAAAVEMKRAEIRWKERPSYVVSLRDVSERKKLFDVKNELARIVESSDDAIFSRDLDDIVLTWNRGAEKIYGYAAGEMIGQSILRIVPEETTAVFLASKERVAAGGSVRNIELLHERKDGSRIPVSVTSSPLLDAEGASVGICSVVKDLTEAKQRERLLAESERRFRTLAANSRDIIFHRRVHPEQAHEFLNPAVTGVLGYAPEEFYADAALLRRIVHEDDRRTLEDAIQRGRFPKEPLALRFRHKDGRLVWLEIRFSRVDDERRRLVAVQGIARDITERIRLEEQLRQAQKVEALGKLSGGVAHDFNNILTVMGASAELALRALKPGDPIAGDLEEIRKGVQRAANLTRQLLLFSKRQIASPKVMNLNDVVVSMEKMLMRIIGENIELKTRLEPALANTRLDPGHFEQVILNLAVNAREAMPEGGRLTIETLNVELDAAAAKTLGLTGPGRYASIKVSDSGAGMDEETRARIFEPFFTTKEHGTGLGLATVQGIVAQGRGSISVESSPGKGAVFNLYFPAVEGRTASEEGASGAAPQRGKETLLLAEDDPGVRALMIRILKGNGYQVLAAGNGADALALAESHPDPIHMLITDMVMPGVGGRELAERLGAARPALKVLYISGYTQDPIFLGRAAGEDVNLQQKPFEPASLLAKVREMLDSGPVAKT